MTQASTFRWPDGYRAAASFTFDLDAESAVLIDHPEAAERLSVMTHQQYGPRTGVPRILRLLEQRRIRATFFVPGYSAERHPDAVRSIRDAGHEIAHHGYLHEPAVGISPDAEERNLLRGLEALDAVAGVRPVGWRAPMWETSYATPGILARNGFAYDSSLMDADLPYRLAVDADDRDGRLVEIPVSWALDDWEQYVYIPGISGTGIIESPAKVLEMWTLELEAMTAAGGCFILTNHPFASGRPSRAAALERLVERAQALPGLWIAPLADIAAHVASLPLAPVRHVPPPLP